MFNNKIIQTMKHHIIKSFSTLLVATCLPVVTSAQYFMSGGIGYQVLSVEDHTVEVTVKESCSPYQGNINIPATVTYNGETYDVVALGDEAFYCASLSSVTIPSSVTKIGYGCFLFANGPTTINVPASVTDIGESAFAASRLATINVDEANPVYRSIAGMLFSKDTSTLVECPAGKTGAVTVPENTVVIAPSAFAQCTSITGVTLPSGLVSIGYWAFTNASRLNNVVIPASVADIGDGLFGGCSALNNLTIESGNTHYYMDGLAIYSMGGDTLISCHKSADSVFLPATLRVIYGFSGNHNVKYVHVPDGVNTIGSNAFNYSTLRSIDLPDQLEEIGYYSFSNCESLTRVAMPSMLERMYDGAFQNCTGLTSIEIPDGLRTVPEAAFFMCTSLSDITWGNAVEVIDTCAFGDCSFTELTLPPTLKTIRMTAFIGDYRGRLKRLTFSAPIDTIEVDAFYSQPLQMLRLKNTVPPATTDDGYGTYGCLDGTDIDSIIVLCGSLNAWLADNYWQDLADRYFEDCNMGIGNLGSADVSVRIYAQNGRIIVDGADGEVVRIYDITGRSVRNEALPRGVYLVKIGNSPAKKVVVMSDSN